MELLRRYSNIPLSLKIMGFTHEVDGHTPASRPARSAGRIHRASQRLDQADIEQLLLDYQGGMPSTQLVIKYQLGKTTVLRLLRLHGVQVREHALPTDQVQQAIRLYAEGLSLAAVGREVGCHHSAVRNILLRAGIPRRDTHGRSRSSR